MKHQELSALILPGWEIRPTVGAVQVISTSVEDAKSWVRGAERSLQSCADRMGFAIEVWSNSGSKAIARIKATASPLPEESPQISSYGMSAIAPSASYEAIADFITGRRQEGLIVTLTSMVSDRCLVVNDLQVLDRGGGWNADNWVGLDFKTLWRDSFLAGATNYYAGLIAGLERDRHIPDFEYRIRRPSGELAEYSSTYSLVENFCGVPARIAVSRVGDWRVV